MSQKFFQVIPPGTSIPFIARARYFVALSLFLLLTGALAMVYNQTTRGSVLNFGIDFQGGSQVRLALAEDVEMDALRTALDELGYEGGSAVRVPDADNEVLIRVKQTLSVDEATEAACAAAGAEIGGASLLPGGFYHPPSSSKMFLKYDSLPDFGAVEQALRDAGCDGRAEPGDGREGEFVVEFALDGIGVHIAEQLDARFGEGTVDHIVSSESVGAKVGNQLKVDGAMSLLYAIGFIFLYVMIRFDLRFAPGGIVALTHDALITVGVFALTWKEFNLQTIAALLTIIGYSINDTIVVFDRIRERIALDRDGKIEDITNAALNDTLSRTILTSGTTLLVVLATWIFGSGPIKDFAFALFIGIVVGTYSSLFVAAPVFLWVNRRFYGAKGHLIGVAAGEGTGMLLSGDAPPTGAIDVESEEGEGSPAHPAQAPSESTGDDGERKASRRRRRPGA